MIKFPDIFKHFKEDSRIFPEVLNSVSFLHVNIKLTILKYKLETVNSKSFVGKVLL